MLKFLIKNLLLIFTFLNLIQVNSYSNPKVDELLEAARASTDQNERARLYQEMQTIVQKDAPWVFVANWKQNAVTSDKVSSFSLQPSFFLLLDGVTKN